MQPELLRVQAQRIGRAAKAVRQRGEVAALFTQSRIASSSWDRYGRPAGTLPRSILRRARTCSGERPSRSARTAADRPAAVPALSSASSARDQGPARRWGYPKVLRRATTASGVRPSRRAIVIDGSWSA